jgi:hypothetical protein
MQKSKSRVRVLGVIQLQDPSGKGVRRSVFEFGLGHVLCDMVATHQKKRRRK